jgi:flagellar basal body rod protein FlgG
MDNSLYLIAAALDFSTQEQQRIANNLANTETAGFKEVLSAMENMPASLQENGGQGIPRACQATVFTQGQLEKTGEMLDVALLGDGFVAVEKNGERRYWRSGHLHVDENGYLATSQGFLVQGEDGPLQLDPARVHLLQIGRYGELALGNQVAGHLKLVRFGSPQKLVSEEGSYRNPTAMQEENSTCEVAQGCVEKSTVQAMQAMSDMIANMRYLETMQKITRVLDEGWQNLLSV